MTRGRILQAAFDALYEVGYARTTTSEVCRRAGVSRGTVLYHFPNTAELVTAAADYVFDRRLAEFRDAFAQRADSDRAGTAIELLWSTISGPTFYAWLELLVAARTDTTLRTRVREVIRRFSTGVEQTYAAMYPDVDMTRPANRLAPAFVFATLNGLALDRIHGTDADSDEVLAALKVLGRFLEQNNETR